MSCHHAPRYERGVTLLVTLVMLVVLTLFAVSAIRLSGVNLKVTGNYQWQKEMEMLTDSALEQIVSSVSNFDNSSVQAGTALDYDICADGTVVASSGCSLLNAKIGTVSAPRCTDSAPAKGYTIKAGELAPDDDNWVLTAQATDSVTGAKITISRGFTIRMLAGNCPQ